MVIYREKIYLQYDCHFLQVLDYPQLKTQAQIP